MVDNLHFRHVKGIMGSITSTQFNWHTVSLILLFAIAPFAAFSAIRQQNCRRARQCVRMAMVLYAFSGVLVWTMTIYDAGLKKAHLDRDCALFKNTILKWRRVRVDVAWISIVCITHNEWRPVTHLEQMTDSYFNRRSCVLSAGVCQNVSVSQVLGEPLPSASLDEMYCTSNRW